MSIANICVPNKLELHCGTMHCNNLIPTGTDIILSGNLIAGGLVQSHDLLTIGLAITGGLNTGEINCTSINAPLVGASEVNIFHREDIINNTINTPDITLVGQTSVACEADFPKQIEIDSSQPLNITVPFYQPVSTPNITLNIRKGFNLSDPIIYTQSGISFQTAPGWVFSITGNIGPLTVSPYIFEWISSGNDISSATVNNTNDSNLQVFYANGVQIGQYYEMLFRAYVITLEAGPNTNNIVYANDLVTDNTTVDTLMTYNGIPINKALVTNGSHQIIGDALASDISGGNIIAKSNGGGNLRLNGLESTESIYINNNAIVNNAYLQIFSTLPNGAIQVKTDTSMAPLANPVVAFYENITTPGVTSQSLDFQYSLTETHDTGFPYNELNPPSALERYEDDNNFSCIKRTLIKTPGAIGNALVDVVDTDIYGLFTIDGDSDHPPYSWQLDRGTGFYRDTGTGKINFTYGTTLSLQMDNNFVAQGNITTNGNFIGDGSMITNLPPPLITSVTLASNTGPTNPSLNFISEPQTGLYTSAGGKMRFTNAGTYAIEFDTGITLNSGGFIGNTYKSLNAGSAAGPFDFYNGADPNSGQYWTTSQFNYAIANTDIASISASGIISNGITLHNLTAGYTPTRNNYYEELNGVAMSFVHPDVTINVTVDFTRNGRIVSMTLPDISDATIIASNAYLLATTGSIPARFAPTMNQYRFASTYDVYVAYTVLSGTNGSIRIGASDGTDIPVGSSISCKPRTYTWQV
jgi:hypothetical protein